MAISVTNNAGNSTLTLTETSTTAKMTATLTDAAHKLWNEGYGLHNPGGTWEGLTNQQKLDVVEDFFVKSIVQKAKLFHIGSASDAAGVTAEQEAPGLYI